MSSIEIRRSEFWYEEIQQSPGIVLGNHKYYILEEVNRNACTSQIINKQLSNIPDGPEDSDTEDEQAISLNRNASQKFYRKYPRTAHAHNSRYREAKAHR